MVIRHRGWRAARESGRRAKGTVYITPEADGTVSQSHVDDQTGWLCCSVIWKDVVFHLRLCIIIATSIDCVVYVRYCELS